MYFARNRLRREMKFEPHLKDYTTTYDVKDQIDDMR